MGEREQQTMEFIKKTVVWILTIEARGVLSRYKPNVIAITGSVGKTSAKDAIYAALSGGLHVRKSEKSMNSETGVPLTILGCESGWKNPLKWAANIAHGFNIAFFNHSYPQWLVLEVGADRPGDIAKIARWLKPTIAVMTAVPEIPSHVEYFDSAEAVFAEKRTLAEYVRPGGSLILNNDDERVRGMRSDFRGIALTYGFEPTADFSASHTETVYDGGKPAGLRFRVNRGGASVPVELRGALGVARIYSALAAFAVGEAAGMDMVTLSRGLAHYTPSPGRMRLIPGIKDSTLIDDTYNSSPEAARAALQTLKELDVPGKRIAVMGDMLELGKYTAEAHKLVGAYAASCVDILITVGLRARATAESARDAGLPEDRILQYEMGESQRAGKELESLLAPGDVVLIKGSQSVRMERAVKEVMAAPQYAGELLVRQDPEWLAKA